MSRLNSYPSIIAYGTSIDKFVREKDGYSDKGKKSELDSRQMESPKIVCFFLKIGSENSILFPKFG